jgi:GntR family transcriptional regulator
MHIQIAPQDGTPIYQQITRQVKYLVASGRLQAGEELPPIRVLAEQLTINPNTVARAYLELEREGVVAKRQGSGTFVSETRSPLPRREKLRVLAKRIDALLAEAAHLEIELDEIVDLIRERQEILLPKESK